MICASVSVCFTQKYVESFLMTLEMSIVKYIADRFQLYDKRTKANTEHWDMARLTSDFALVIFPFHLVACLTSCISIICFCMAFLSSLCLCKNIFYLLFLSIFWCRPISSIHHHLSIFFLPLHRRLLSSCVQLCISLHPLPPPDLHLTDWPKASGSLKSHRHHPGCHQPSSNTAAPSPHSRRKRRRRFWSHRVWCLSTAFCLCCFGCYFYRQYSDWCISGAVYHKHWKSLDASWGGR